MAWDAKFSESVRDELNGLRARDQLSRQGWLYAYNSVRLELPKQVRRFRDKRYPHDPDFFLYRVGFSDREIWHQFEFFINDKVRPNLLIAEDVDHETRPG
jgi:hypothetical protein